MEANEPGLKWLLADAEMKWDSSLSVCKVMLFQVTTNRGKGSNVIKRVFTLEVASLSVLKIPCMRICADAALPGASPGPELPHV